MKKIALTGNMGCGKSYVLHCIEECQIPTLDMDTIAKEVRVEKNNEIYELLQVREKEELANLIFHDQAAKHKLEAFMYPYMIEKMMDFFKQYENEKIGVVEVPLLFEKNWDIYFDEYWVVACDEKVALDRLSAYRHISKEEALRRWNNQMPLIDKMKKAHKVIYNNKDCKEEVRKMIEEELHVEKRGFINIRDE